MVLRGGGGGGYRPSCKIKPSMLKYKSETNISLTLFKWPPYWEELERNQETAK